MSHRNARLTPRGRLLLVQRVRDQGMPVAHVAKAMGISRQCAIAGCGASTRRVWPDSRTVRADLIVRLGAPTPAVSAESWPPAESTAAAQPNWPS